MHEKLCARSESRLSIDSRCLCSQSDCEFANSQPLGYAKHIYVPCLFQVEIGKGYTSIEWREDLKAILRKTAEGDMHGVFLFPDTQVSVVCC